MKNYLQEHVDRRFKEGQEPAGRLRELAGETRAAVEALDSSRFVRSLLEKSAQILDARCAVLHLENGVRRDLMVGVFGTEMPR